MEKGKYKIFIDSNELKQRIIDCITSNEIDKFIKNTVFENDESCRQAIIHGMLIAGMMTSECELVFINGESESKETVENESDFDNETVEEILGLDILAKTDKGIYRIIKVSNFKNVESSTLSIGRDICTKNKIVLEINCYGYEIGIN